METTTLEERFEAEINNTEYWISPEELQSDRLARACALIAEEEKKKMLEWILSRRSEDKSIAIDIFDNSISANQLLEQFNNRDK